MSRLHGKPCWLFHGLCGLSQELSHIILQRTLCVLAAALLVECTIIWILCIYLFIYLFQGSFIYLLPDLNTVFSLPYPHLSFPIEHTVCSHIFCMTILECMNLVLIFCIIWLLWSKSLLGALEMAYWLKICSMAASMKTKVWIPKTHLNARWVYPEPVIPALRRQRWDPKQDGWTDYLYVLVCSFVAWQNTNKSN